MHPVIIDLMFRLMPNPEQGLKKDNPHISLNGIFVPGNCSLL